jgi:predicted TIM-barrel fold metal-dependent hydrolase
VGDHLRPVTTAGAKRGATLRWAGLAALLLLLNVAVWFRGKGHAREARPARSYDTPAYLADDPALLAGALGPRRFAIVDVHEHAQTEADVERLLAAMKPLGIARACVVGSSRVTFDHHFDGGFEGWEENDEALLRAKAKHPAEVCVFVTLDPLAEGNVERLDRYVARGADGLKLYLGHSGGNPGAPFHSMPLDDPRMEPVFAYAERTRLPIVLHVELARFGPELDRLLRRHPMLRLDLPHFGVYKNTEERLEKLGKLLDTYAHVYADMSFGAPEIQIGDFETLSANHQRMASFVARHADRLMFASDLVLTEGMKPGFAESTLRSYMQMLEEPRFRFFLRPERPMHGLALSDEVLRLVYEETPKAFLERR